MSGPSTQFNLWIPWIEPDRLAWPWALWALALIPIALLVRRLGARPGRAVYTQGAMLGRPSWRVRSRWAPAAVRALALALLVLAVSRPQRAEQRTESTAEAVAIQLVLDRSGSMDEEATLLDGQALKRFDAAKEILAEFVRGETGGPRDGLRGREGDLLGLIAFGTYADTIVPMTQDHESLLESIESLEVLTHPSERNTSIGEAIAIASARLKAMEDALAEREGNEGFTLKSKAIVLLTDGENRSGLDPRTAGTIAADAGVKIYSVGIRGGVRRGGFFNTQSIDEQLLSDLAGMTGGVAWAVDSGDELRGIYRKIDELERTTIQLDGSVSYEDIFPPLAIAAALLLAIESLLSSLVYRRLA